MLCKLFIADENGIIERSLGSTSIAFLDSLILFAESENLVFLAGIENDAATIFNTLQLSQVKREIQILAAKHRGIDIVSLNLFVGAIEQALEEGPHTYLKILCNREIRRDI